RLPSGASATESTKPPDVFTFGDVGDLGDRDRRRRRLTLAADRERDDRDDDEDLHRRHTNVSGSTCASPRANRAMSSALASMVTARPCTSISAMSWPAIGPCMKPWPLKPAMMCSPAAPGTALTIPV